MVWRVWVFVAALTVVLAGNWACDHTLPTGTGGGSATNGAIVTVGFGGGDVFQPSAVTIMSGSAITWYYAGGDPHTVNVDDGTGTSSCADYDFTTSAPGTQVVETFNHAGEYPFHCDVHSDCGSNPLPNCGVVCTIMTGSVSVR